MSCLWPRSGKQERSAQVPLFHMWTRSSIQCVPKVPDVHRIWAETMLLSGKLFEAKRYDMRKTNKKHKIP